MLSLHRINPNNTNKRTKKASNTNFDSDSQPNSDVKRPKRTSNYPTETNTKSNRKNKDIVKPGSMQENNEFNEHFLDAILDNNDIRMDLAMQQISTDKTVRSETVQVLKDFNCQSLTTQAKKGEQLVSMIPAIKKTFNLLGNDVVELHKEKESLKNKIGSYDEKWLEESKQDCYNRSMTMKEEN